MRRHKTAHVVSALVAGLVFSGTSWAEPIAPFQVAFFDKVASFFSAEKPVFQSLKPGAYEPSNEAIGLDRDVDNVRIQGNGLVHLPQLEIYLNKQYDRLKAASGLESIPGRVYIAANSGLDAGSTADGNVFVAIGWLRTFESEDEVLALLAHELSHVLLHHHDSNFVGRAYRQVQNLYAATAELRAVAEALVNKQSQAQVSPQVFKHLRNMQLLLELYERALHPAWNRTQEREADRLAVDLLAKLDRSVMEGMKPFLEHVIAWESDLEQQKTDDRQRVQAQIEALAQEGKLDEAISKALKNAGDSILDILGKRHDEGEKRLEDMLSYYEKHYPERNDAAPQGKPKELSSKAVTDTFNSYQEVFKTDALMKEGKQVVALSKLQSLAKSSPIGNHALLNERLSVAAEQTGNGKLATQALEKAKAAPEPIWRTFETLADRLWRQGQKNAASQVIDYGFRAFKEAPALMPVVVKLQRRYDNPKRMAELVGVCQWKTPEYRDECNKATR